MNQYTIKDLKKALDYMENTLKVNIINLDVDDYGRMKISAHDISSNHVQITVYKANDTDSTKMAEITETRRL